MYVANLICLYAGKYYDVSTPPPPLQNKQLNYLRCTHFQSMTQSTIKVERR